MLREYRAIRMQGGQETTGRPLALIRLTNAGSCPSRQRDCVAEHIRLLNADAPLLLRSQARRKAYRARSAETKGTAQLPLRGQVRRKEKGRPYNDANAVMTERILRHEYTILAW